MDYLERQGHTPVKHMTGGRISYLCPLPWHSETKPSFVVYTNSEYQNFYCFGCASRYNIIHLVSLLESISVKTAIERLSDGMDFTVIDDEKLEIKMVQDVSGIISPVEDLARVLIDISVMCKSHLKATENDSTEKNRIEKLWTLIDSYVLNFEFEKIEEIRYRIGPLLKQSLMLARKRYIEKKYRRDTL